MFFFFNTKAKTTTNQTPEKNGILFCTAKEAKDGVEAALNDRIGHRIHEFFFGFLQGAEDDGGGHQKTLGLNEMRKTCYVVVKNYLKNYLVWSSDPKSKD